MFTRSIFTILAIILFIGCDESSTGRFDYRNVAGTDEVANYMEAFEGRGALTDDSQPTPAALTLSHFSSSDDLQIDLVLSEPEVNQPLELTFDERGRMWVVQYNQYPYPEGLKVTGIDNHLRAEFDKIPSPPPTGTPGADKITFFEDTNGDGLYDKSTDAITGLNIATGVAFGRGRIWVLNPPYLLSYKDDNSDGLPDGPAEVNLRGFGLQDTHAVANSLRWGPDGWLYGATGSTVVSNISSLATTNLHFEGQSIWRYHPETEIFELFAEGGGNTFHVEIDAKGRIYSGDNGVSRGQYYKQGGYYEKNWGKHGALTNPYAFGFLPNMILDGDKKRFTHAWIKYEANALPVKYRDRMIAINPLLNYIQLTDMVHNGSTFSNHDLERIVETNDRWFRPVDIKAGPDGAVYIADWYDSRLTHVDPNDTWHKSSGRIYRIRSGPQQIQEPFNIGGYTNDQLITLLSHPNKWYRQQAIRIFGDRKDKSVIPRLKEILVHETGQLALESLWAINVSGYFEDEIAQIGLSHKDPFVRMWSVRLIGDFKNFSTSVYDSMLELAAVEQNPEVQSQLACTAKRLPGTVAIPIIKEVIMNASGDDPDNPLLLWWALESKIDQYGDLVLDMLNDPKIWNNHIVKLFLLERLAQRMIMDGNKSNLVLCTKLLSLAPTKESVKPLLDGIQEGLRGKDLSVLPKELLTAIQPHLKQYGQAPLSFQIQQGNAEAIDQALSTIADENSNIVERQAYIQLMGSSKVSESIPVLLKLVETVSSRVSVRQASLRALANFEDHKIGKGVAMAYPDRLRSEPTLRLAALDLLSTRAPWTKQLFQLIMHNKQVSADDVPVQVVQQMLLLDDQDIKNSINQLWPEVFAVSNQEKKQDMERIAAALKEGTGNEMRGKNLYKQLCGSCHQLNGEGGAMGPDLTGYERNNIDYLILNMVDPSLEIREGYVNYKVIRKDGRILTGTITDRTGETLQLKSISGEEIVVPTAQIQDLEAQSISLMPERLTDHLTDQQLRDLFSYIMKAGTNPDI